MNPLWFCPVRLRGTDPLGKPAVPFGARSSTALDEEPAMKDPRSHRDVHSRLDRFSQLLGWNGLRVNKQELDGHPQAIVWYVAGDTTSARTHFALQINQHPLGSCESFSAAVNCIRYRLCSGWHSFRCADLPQAEAEARRLRSWLGREWFASPERRRAYRVAHPECARCTWKRLRESGEPHYPDAAF